ncbi:acyltransferase [Corynebacterium breve]|uniref:Acyltransferase n=1 Tax=Corynebacterium breve TaxID=3049799 RepID=A0ABY8VEV5_9CORY|nr:acyltransferase [Corynebacterium breve]WIM67491.1 acyltransferase [Corynebacterium breve]
MTGGYKVNRSTYLGELEGLRAVAALGIVVTHVAFQTATDSALFARFDYFVAVFFALSAFLLARGGHRKLYPYIIKRTARIAPAYLACVGIVLVALPEAGSVSLGQAAANLAMLQIYVPDGLIAGLTQLWSLCVEVAFYLVLPLYLALGRKGRLVALVAGIIVGFAWPWLPFVRDSIEIFNVNLQIWPMSYASWFAVGLVCAELEGRVSPLVQRVLRARWVYWIAALTVAWLAGQEYVGPLGLEHPSPLEFNIRILLGAVFCALIVVPYALAPSQGVLGGEVMRTLGTWSYSIFLWHVAVLTVVFPLLGIPMFSGYFFAVLAATVVLSIAVSYISYELVERPGARWIQRVGGARHTSAAQPATTIATEFPA